MPIQHTAWATRPRRLLVFTLLSLASQLLMATESTADSPAIPIRSRDSIRIASYNVSLYGGAEGELRDRLLSGDDQQAQNLARVIQTVRPDILLLCEIDHDPDSKTLKIFAEQYLLRSFKDSHSKPIDYPTRWSVPSNTGMPASMDLNSDDKTQLPDDAWGYGAYQGQYAMSVLSRYRIDTEDIRTFQKFRWAEMPDALRPVDPDSGKPFFDDQTWNQLRLSSKNHIDVPIRIGSSRLHLLASHPTPPVFDGKEDRNGCRNHDEIRFWFDYISGDREAYLVDDRGQTGGLGKGQAFVIAGDLNSDPKEGDSRQAAIRDLLSHPAVQDPKPLSRHQGVATASFGRRMVRVDYVIPSRELEVVNSGVVWPNPETELGTRVTASDHRMVWIDIRKNSLPVVAAE